MVEQRGDAVDEEVAQPVDLHARDAERVPVGLVCEPVVPGHLMGQRAQPVHARPGRGSRRRPSPVSSRATASIGRCSAIAWQTAPRMRQVARTAGVAGLIEQRPGGDVQLRRAGAERGQPQHRVGVRAAAHRPQLVQLAVAVLALEVVDDVPQYPQAAVGVAAVVEVGGEPQPDRRRGAGRCSPSSTRPRRRPPGPAPSRRSRARGSRCTSRPSPGRARPRRSSRRSARPCSARACPRPGARTVRSIEPLRTATMAARACSSPH